MVQRPRCFQFRTPQGKKRCLSIFSHSVISTLTTLCLSFIFLFLTKFSLLSPPCHFVFPFFKGSLMPWSCRVSRNQEPPPPQGCWTLSLITAAKARANSADWNHTLAYIIFLLITENWFCSCFLSSSSSLPPLFTVIAFFFLLFLTR